MKKEQEVLENILWPKEKMNMAGNLSFSNSADFKTMTTIDVSRTEKSLEVFYCNAPILNPGDKKFFVKLYMNKEGDNYVVDFKKSSPELKTEKDIEDALNTVKNAIIKMNVKPSFFPTSVIENKLKNKM